MQDFYMTEPKKVPKLSVNRLTRKTINRLRQKLVSIYAKEGHTEEELTRYSTEIAQILA